MRIIVLQEMPNRGKTQTLKLLYEMLITPKGNGRSQNKQPLGGDPNDFSDIVDWNNKRIAFFTMGDFSTYLADAIYRYDHQKCDVLICALSINTPKVRANNALNNFNTTRISKTVATRSSGTLAANTADAQTILNLLR